MSKEGGLDAPTRHPIPWDEPAFLDQDLLEQEMERQFDVCHGCRRCFNLCDAFPKLFDLIDATSTGETAQVKTEDYPTVANNCTLCDMCYMTKCPYVPPHAFNIDFPHLMLRYKAYQRKHHQTSIVSAQLAETDRNASIFKRFAPVLNAVNKEGSPLRPIVEKTLGIDRRAAIPAIAKRTLIEQIKNEDAIPITSSTECVVLYATCYGNYNDTRLGLWAKRIIEHFGVNVEVVYPGCCGMPLYEQGNLTRVAVTAENIANFFSPYIEKNKKIIALLPSCGLMIKNEWPLLHPLSETVQKLKEHTLDICEYIANLIQRYGMPPIQEQPSHVFLHLACHARAQNMGAKAAEILSYIPQINVEVIERCSGHGGIWGMKQENFDTALKVGKPVVKKIHKTLETAPPQHAIVTSECPLASMHIRQGLEQQTHQTITIDHMHPLEIFGRALGLDIDALKLTNNRN